jgi:hypothetical protein
MNQLESCGDRLIFARKLRGVALLVAVTAVPLLSLTVSGQAAAGGGFGGGPPGPPVEFFSDSFEQSAPGWWFSTSSQGNGWVVHRSDCLSASHCADMYGPNATGEFEALSKAFTLFASQPTSTLDCDLLLRVHAMTDAHVRIEIQDSVTRAVIRSIDQQLSASSSWVTLSTVGQPLLNLSTQNVILIRVYLQGSGSWQEIVFDELTGSCSRQGP